MCHGLAPATGAAAAGAGAGQQPRPSPWKGIALQFHVFTIERLGLGRGRRGERCVVGLACPRDIALGCEHVAADFVEDRRERTGLGDVEQLERVVVLALLGEHAGEA